MLNNRLGQKGRRGHRRLRAYSYLLISYAKIVALTGLGKLPSPEALAELPTSKRGQQHSLEMREEQVRSKLPVGVSETAILANLLPL